MPSFIHLCVCLLICKTSRIYSSATQLAHVNHELCLYVCAMMSSVSHSIACIPTHFLFWLWSLVKISSADSCCESRNLWAMSTTHPSNKLQKECFQIPLREHPWYILLATRGQQVRRHYPAACLWSHGDTVLAVFYSFFNTASLLMNTFESLHTNCVPSQK